MGFSGQPDSKWNRQARQIVKVLDDYQAIGDRAAPQENEPRLKSNSHETDP